MKEIETLNALSERVWSQTSAEKMVFSSFMTSTEVMERLVEKGITFKVLLGSYKGERETSYETPFSDFVQVMQSGILDGQESILLIGGNSGTDAVLLFNKFNADGSLNIERLGELTVLDPAVLKDYKAWSYDPAAGLYYGTVNAA